MKVALIGASGFVGKALLHELTNRGHAVTAIARNTGSIVQNDGVTAVQADVFNLQQLVDALKGHDVIVSAYNAGWTNPNLHDEFFAGSKAIQQAAKQAGVKRLIVLGGAGSLFVAEGVKLIDTPQFPKEFKAGASAASEYLDLIREEQDLDWTFVSPAIEMHQGTSGERKGHYRSGLENPVFDANHRSIISVEDLSLAIVDEVEKPKHIRQRFTVAY